MHRSTFAISAILGIFIIAPASAQVVITQAKALAGGITPGDTAGYPVTLSQPGAYRLESNLSVPAGAVGIAANNNNIDIDLNGFTISGSGVGGWGIASPYGQSRIHDGVVKSFGNSGIYIRGDVWTIENMKIVQNGGFGVDAINARLIVLQNSLVTSNRSLGIMTGEYGYFKNNQVVSNENSGIVCTFSCHVEGNLVSFNKSEGIVVYDGFVIGNTITQNLKSGLFDAGRGIDAGYTNNMFIGNNPTGAQQINSGVVVDPNFCFGRPCTAP